LHPLEGKRKKEILPHREKGKRRGVIPYRIGGEVSLRGKGREKEKIVFRVSSLLINWGEGRVVSLIL